MTDETHRRAENVEAIAAVTPMQQGILFHSLQVHSQDPYFIQRVFVIEGAVDAGALGRAWQAVVDRHQVLRADYRWEEAQKPAQIIYKARPIAIALENWRDVSPDAQPARLRALLSEQRARGFDLRDASEARVRLIELGEDRHWLVWSYHHIALDGWSAALVLGEVLAAYHAFTTSEAFSAAEAPRYTTYVDWIHKQDPARSLEYWKELLAGAELPTPLPPAGAAREGGHAEQVFTLSGADSERLRERARKLGVTQSTFVQAAWALALARHTSIADVVFGATVAGRSAELPGIDATVGLFINTLPARVRIPSAIRLRDWLLGIQAQSLDSRRYEHTPLGEIRRAAELAGDRNLFESVVVFENYPLDEVLERRPAGIRLQPMAASEQYGGVRTTGRNNYPLTLNVVPGEPFVLTLAYRRDRFDDAAMTALGAQLQHLLRVLGERPDARLGEIGLFAGEVPAKAPAAQDSTLMLEAFARSAATAPRAIALQSETRAITYAELDAASNRVARYLHAHGAGAERVGLIGERSVEFVIGVLGIWKAGAAYVPIDAKLPLSRQAELASESRTAVVLECVSLGRLASAYGDAPLAARARAEQPAYLIFTSGSTGRPKAVVVSHGALAGYVHGLVETLAIAPGSSFAMASTVAADLGHTVLFGSLATGGCLHLLAEQRAFDPDGFAEYLAEHAVEILKIVPSHLAALLHAAQPARALPDKLLILGGEACEWPLVARVRELCPSLRVVNHYGPTEATVGAAAHELRATLDTRTVPIGRALPSSLLEVLDADLNRVPAGVEGELFIGGERLADGYFDAASATAARFIPNPYGEAGARLYRTGDRVKRHANGELEFLGRVDRQIKLRGYRIELGEIESRLRECEGVKAAAVAPRTPASGATQLIAYVEGSTPADSLHAHLRARLPEYMVPERIMHVAALPLTRNGKLDHASLPVAAPPQPMAAEASAATDVEARLMGIWKDVLKVERVGVLDDFFELGGDSILSLQVVARARRRGLKVTPQQLFEHRTVRALAAVATALQPKAAPAQLANPDAGGLVPLLPAQARFFARELPEPHRYNQSVLLRPRERLDPARLEGALLSVVAHHPALRLRFRRNAAGRLEQLHAPPPAAGEALLWLRHAATAAEIEAIADSAHASLDLARGPILRAVLIDGTADGQRLLLVIHHLAVDGVSWRVLLEDVQAWYRGAGLPAATTPAGDWAVRLHAQAASAALERELPYWREQQQSGAEGVPPDRAGARNLVQDEARCVLELTREHTQQLLRSGRPMPELLLAALTRAVCRQSRSARLLVELEGHGREAAFDGADLSRTVGWFTSLYPVLLTPGSGSIQDSVRAIGEQLRAIPERGIGYGALRYLAPDRLAAQLRALPEPRVTFNYLGQFDASFDAGALFEPAREPDGRGQSERAARANWLVITGQIYGGALRLVCAYSREMYRAETIEALVRAYQSELQALLETGAA